MRIWLNTCTAVVILVLHVNIVLMSTFLTVILFTGNFCTTYQEQVCAKLTLLVCGKPTYFVTGVIHQSHLVWVI